MAHDVFISYAMEDKEAAEKVCRALEEEGIECWIAPRDVPLGRNYEEAIVDGIAASRLLILVLSPHSNASPHVTREIQKACVEGSKTEILPFRIGDVPYNKALSYYLGSMQWLDASTPPLEQHLKPLVQHVRARLPRINESPLAASRGNGGDPPPAEPIPPSFKDLRVTTGIEDGRKPLPVMWIAVGVGALLLVIVVAFVATRSRGGGSATNNSFNSNLATPAVNSNANQNASPTPQPRTPTPTPTPRRTPTRVFPTNLNIKRPLNTNR